MSTGFSTYLPSADLTRVRYPAVALKDCEYTINLQTMEGTLLNLARAPMITPHASADLIWHGPTKTKRADSSWLILVQDSDNWIKNTYISAKYPGLTEGFYVFSPDPSRPGRKQLAIASGSTHLGQGSKRAPVLVLTDYLGPYPVPEAEDAPITNHRGTQTTNGTSR
jgi:hypothetical protein